MRGIFRSGEMLTERDIRLLKFMSNWSFMLLEQSAKYLGCSHQVARRRLASLVESGLVDKSNLLGARLNFYSVNRAGLEYLGSALEGTSPKGVKLAQLEHDRILVDIAIDFAVKNPSYEIVGELEMRRRNSAAVALGEEPQFAISRFSGGRFVNVFPDMVAIKNGKYFYTEYEHTPKDKKRLASLMSAYANSSKVTAVQYIVSAAAVNHVRDVYSSIEHSLPKFGGVPKIIIKEYGQE